MTTFLTLGYGLYFLLVGIHGNAEEFLSDITQEKQFVYWLIALGIIAGLWESPVGSKIAKPAATLVVLGFLLSNNNYQTIRTHFDNLMSGNLSNG